MHLCSFKNPVEICSLKVIKREKLSHDGSHRFVIVAEKDKTTIGYNGVLCTKDNL